MWISQVRSAFDGPTQAELQVEDFSGFPQPEEVGWSNWNKNYLANLSHCVFLQGLYQCLELCDLRFEWLQLEGIEHLVQSHQNQSDVELPKCDNRCGHLAKPRQRNIASFTVWHSRLPWSKVRREGRSALCHRTGWRPGPASCNCKLNLIQLYNFLPFTPLAII